MLGKMINELLDGSSATGNYRWITRPPLGVAERSSSAAGVGLCSAALLLLMFRKAFGLSRENPCPILLAVKLWSLVRGWAA